MLVVATTLWPYNFRTDVDACTTPATPHHILGGSRSQTLLLGAVALQTPRGPPDVPPTVLRQYVSPWVKYGLRPVRIALVFRILLGVWGQRCPRIKPEWRASGPRVCWGQHPNGGVGRREPRGQRGKSGGGRPLRLSVADRGYSCTPRQCTFTRGRRCEGVQHCCGAGPNP